MAEPIRITRRRPAARDRAARRAAVRGLPLPFVR
jgi:hypothetical protein